MATQITRKSEKSGNKNGLIGLLVFAAIVALGSIALFKQMEQADNVVIDQSVVINADRKSVGDLLAGNETLNKLASLLNKSGFSYASDKSYTIFAPTNEAFAKIDVDTMGNLEEPANVEQLKSVLNYHVVESKFALKDLVDGQVLTASNGSQITVSVKDGLVSLKDGKGQEVKVSGEVVGTNGIIHYVDTVLMAQ
jgi:uncharacterized surface protein with fasciclin (FAS1) repeats